MHVFTLLPILLAASPLAQKPASGPATAPAEIVPPKAAPAAGKVVETPGAGSLSPGTVPPPAPAANPLDGMSDGELDEIVTLLRQRSIASTKLTDLELKRATVQGLLQRLGAGATLLTKAGETPSERVAWRTEILPGRIGYLRVGTLDKPGLEELDRMLAGFAEKGVGAHILDLRALPPGVDFELAADLCRRWSPKGKTLFTVRKPGAAEQIFAAMGEPVAKGLLTVLTCAENAGSAEIVAGALRASARAVVFGERTRGQAAEMAEVKLASGAVLRFAVAEVKLAGGETLVPAGVTPDVAVEVPAGSTAKLLKEGEKGLAPLLTEIDRPHLNEAALVAGRNPEMEARANSARLRVPASAVLRDTVLQRAIDLAMTVAVFEKGERR